MSKMLVGNEIHFKEHFFFFECKCKIFNVVLVFLSKKKADLLDSAAKVFDNFSKVAVAVSTFSSGLCKHW